MLASLGAQWVAAQAQAPAAYTVQVSLLQLPQLFQGQPLLLWQARGNEFKRIDSVRISGGQVVFRAAKWPGLYKLGLYPQTAASFVLGQETEVNILARYQPTNMGFDLNVPTLDQQAHDKFLEARRNYEVGFSALTRDYQNQSAGITNEALKQTLLAQAYARTDSLALLFNRWLDTVQLQFPKTYAARILCQLARAEVPPRGLGEAEITALRRKNFFKYVDFGNPEILNNDFIHLKIFQYVQELRDPTAADFKAAIDTLMRRASAHPDVRSFMFNYLVELFNIRGPDEVTAYVVEKYRNGTLGISQKTQLVMNRLGSLRPGSPAPDVAAPDTNGRIQRLSEHLGEGATLLYVFSSTCGHCREATPKVHQLYLKYRDQGFRVFCVSLDTDGAEWRKFIRENHLAWTNVSELKGYETNVLYEYGLRRTPYAVLLDPQGRILHLDVQPEALEEKLKPIFGE